MSHQHGGSIFDLNKIKAEIIQDETQKKAKKVNISLEEVQNIWDKYSDEVTLRGVQTALRMAKLSIDSDGNVQITVPSTYLKDMVMLETPLLNAIRTAFGNNEMKFLSIIDKNAFPDYEEPQSNAPMNPREKYVKLLEKNPNLGQLTKKLGLKLDNEFT